jgi:hypothetical protein
MTNLQQIINQKSGTVSANGDSGPLPVGAVDYISLDINISAIGGSASLSVTFYIDRQGLDGNWYNIYSSSAQTSTGTITANLGPGLGTNVSLGSVIRLRWVLAGTAPSATFSGSIIGK